MSGFYQGAGSMHELFFEDNHEGGWDQSVS